MRFGMVVPTTRYIMIFCRRFRPENAFSQRLISRPWLSRRRVGI